MSRITFQKRQKEMKRQEKQRAKAERRLQKKLAKRATLSEETMADIGEFRGRPDHASEPQD